MPPSVEDRLRDILEAILEIEQLLEIVCEASRTVPESMKQHGSGIDWRKMIDFGNLLRHAYHSTRAEAVWDIVQNHLPLLKSFAEHHIRGSGK
jgi:uncharacterized protein with HEPN domain